MKHVTITTDGSCLRNPGGPGGYAAILRCSSSGRYREITGQHPCTTNNVMELAAIVAGLKALLKPCRVLVRTDSQIAMAWCRPGALARIRKNPKRERKLAHVIPLIAEFAEVRERHQVNFEWVRGHSGDRDNERADELANRACMTQATTRQVFGLDHLLSVVAQESIPMQLPLNALSP